MEYQCNTINTINNKYNKSLINKLENIRTLVKCTDFNSFEYLEVWTSQLVNESTLSYYRDEQAITNSRNFNHPAYCHTQGKTELY